MLNDFLDFNLTQFAIAICGIVVTWVLTRVGTSLDKKAKSETSSTELNSAKAAYETLSQVCEDVVKYLNASLVNDLKDAAADGKLTDTEAKEIFAKAFTSVTTGLSDDIKSLVQTYYGDLETIITRKIENYVESNKTSVSWLANLASPLECEEVPEPVSGAVDVTAENSTTDPSN